MGTQNELKEMTMGDIVEYLGHLNNKEMDNFLPIRAFSALVTNTDYDPDNFYQEIEDTETNNFSDRLKLLKHYNFVWGTWNDEKAAAQYKLLENSQEWLKNHSKGSKVSIRSAVMYGRCKLIKNQDGEYIRTFCHNELINRFKEWKDDLNKQNIKIYKII